MKKDGTEIFKAVPDLDYEEPVPEINTAEFVKVVTSRRSVRVYDGTPIPEQVVQTCLDLALLAPNSSNLQAWEFYWVRTEEKRKQIVEACLSQPAARTAAELIVCVGRTATWRRNSQEMLRYFDKVKAPASARLYYQKLVPVIYTQGWFNVFGWIKKPICFVRGLFSPTPREPTSHADMRLWAVKTTSLAAENLMLAFRAHGFDSCPMEGYDSARVKKILKLPRDACVAMIISAGKRSPKGVYGPRVRFDRGLFIKEV